MRRLAHVPAAARYSRWKGFLAHDTKTCDDDTMNTITDGITTPATLYGIRALPAIHDRPAQRDFPPDKHLVDGGYTSVIQQDQGTRGHGITLVGPVRKKRTRRSRQGKVCDHDASTIGRERQQVVCPQGKPSPGMVDAAVDRPCTRGRFAKEDCGQCPFKSNCTHGDRQQLTFPPQQLYERQVPPSRDATHGAMGEVPNGRASTHCWFSPP